MKSNLDHLPQKQQDELARVVDTLLREFDAAIAGGTMPWRRNGKILKIILFGSYARGDFVDEPQNGYLSDFDLLVIVNNERLTDIADFFWTAEQKILHDPAIGRIVNLIVHDMDEVNGALTQGQYFFSEIVRDGVMLFEAPDHPLATPQPRTPLDVMKSAENYFNTHLRSVDEWLEIAQFAMSKSDDAELGYRRKAAFQLHQAVESAYVTFLLVRTLYSPRSHNIKFLRSLAEDHDQSLADAWPRVHRDDRRHFERLKRAYVEARYSDQFKISNEELAWSLDHVRQLRDLVRRACETILGRLRRDAGETA